MDDPRLTGELAAFARRFVREGLGCSCPEEVLDRIGIDAGDPALTRLRVGGRLLVHLIACPAWADPAPILPRRLAAGVAERDAGGFNRFRLVLATEEPARLRPAAEAAFASLGMDARTHLHVVTLAEAALLKPRVGSG